MILEELDSTEEFMDLLNEFIDSDSMLEVLEASGVLSYESSIKVNPEITSSDKANYKNINFNRKSFKK